MNHNMGFVRASSFIVLGICVAVAASSGSQASLIPTGADVGTLRFDAILELNAPILETYAVLFARYWVSKDHYTIGIVWAEPHIGNLNFPVYPVSIVIHSTSSRFDISHQVHHRVDSQFFKPVGTRPIFQHRFDAYDFGNIRFAESEALACRVYAETFVTNDVNESGWRGFTLTSVQEARKGSTDIRDVKIHAVAGQVDEVHLIGKNDTLLKTIRYAYSPTKDDVRVHNQEVMVYPRNMILAVGGEGIPLSVNEKKYSFRTFPLPYPHETHKVTIDYTPTILAGQTISIPTLITVGTASDSTIIRSARMFNFAAGHEDAPTCRQAGERFAHLNAPEETCRQMLTRYWLKDPRDVAPEDVRTLKELRTLIEDSHIVTMTPGEELKCINKLLEIDWILADTSALEKDYDQYSSIVLRNNLPRVVLHGGYHIIETTVRWGLLRTADRMREKWISGAISVNDANVVQNFADSQIEHGRLWCAAGLLDQLLANASVSSKRFEVSALRSKALGRLLKSIKLAEETTDEFSLMQAGWVASSVGIEGLREMARRSFDGTSRLYGALGQPTEEQKVLMARAELAQPRTERQVLPPTDVEK